jgi:hypothetical protein
MMVRILPPFKQEAVLGSCILQHHDRNDVSFMQTARGRNN